MKEVCPKTFDSFDCVPCVCACVWDWHTHTHARMRPVYTNSAPFLHVHKHTLNTFFIRSFTYPWVRVIQWWSVLIAHFIKWRSHFSRLWMCHNLYTAAYVCAYDYVILVWQMVWFRNKMKHSNCTRAEECMIQIWFSKFMSSGGKFIISYNDDVGTMLVIWWVLPFVLCYWNTWIFATAIAATTNRSDLFATLDLLYCPYWINFNVEICNS